MAEKIVGNAAELRTLFPASLDSCAKQRISLWSSPEALAAHVSGLKASDAWYPNAWREGEVKFFGAKDMATAIDICRKGWPEGAARAARLRDKINAANPMGPRIVKWDVAGAYPSVSRALSGNPMNMRRIDSAKLRRKPVITLLSDYANSFHTNGDAITNRAAVVAAIVDAIEAAGYSCHVIGYQCTKDCHGNGTLQMSAVTVKEPSYQADIGKLAFGLGHVAMFRRLSWATIVEDSYTSGISEDLGRPTRIPPLQNGCTFNLPSTQENESAFKSEELAATKGLAFLINSLVKQGCPAFPKAQAA